MNITKALVERTQAPATSQIFFRDDEITGFALRVTAGGVKSFVWEGRVKGRMRRVTLGQYPTLSVLIARQKALAMKVSVSEGRDPSTERKHLNHERTFAALADHYIEEHAKPRKKSWAEDERRIEAHL